MFTGLNTSFVQYTLLLIAVLQPILSSSKHIDKSADYSYLHPWLGTGLLTSAGDITILHGFTYTTALRTVQLILWGGGSVEMMKKCSEVAWTPTVFEIRFDINVSILFAIRCTVPFLYFYLL